MTTGISKEMSGFYAKNTIYCRQNLFFPFLPFSISMPSFVLHTHLLHELIAYEMHSMIHFLFITSMYLRSPQNLFPIFVSAPLENARLHLASRLPLLSKRFKSSLSLDLINACTLFWANSKFISFVTYKQLFMLLDPMVSPVSFLWLFHPRTTFFPSARRIL